MPAPAHPTSHLLPPTLDWTVSPETIVTVVEAAANRYETPCGTGQLVWRRWGQSLPGRRPLVLLHGGSGSWTHWIKVLPALSQNTEVWCPDMPGLGDSAMPAGEPTPANAGIAIGEGFRHLFAEQPEADLVGFSFGAHVGTFVAAELGTRIATFTISGCAALGIPHSYHDFAREHARMTEAERTEVHRANLARLMFHDPARIDALAIHTHALNMRHARFKSRAFAASNDIPETLPRVTARLGAIWGAQDCIATPSVEARYDILKRSHPELRTATISDAGHWVAYEQPEAFVRALRDLIG